MATSEVSAADGAAHQADPGPGCSLETTEAIMTVAGAGESGNNEPTSEATAVF
jgi:hypothetical protein